MAKPMTADQTIAALKKWKVRYREYPGWRTRTRPGGITDARGIVEHHTGGSGQSDAYLHFLFVEGRPADGIPGPLCNVATAADGTLNLGATGRANHAGSGSQATLDHVTAEDYSGYAAELNPGPDGVNGNEHYYGNEIMYTGTAAPTDAAYRTAVLHAAAVCDFHGWSALSAIAHREHTRRKNDPGKVAMNRFRTDLATVLRIGPNVAWSGKTPKAPASTGPTPTPTPPKDGIMSTAETELAAAGRYSDLKDTMVKWAEEHDADRQAALITHLDALAEQLTTLLGKVNAVASAVALIKEKTDALPKVP